MSALPENALDAMLRKFAKPQRLSATKRRALAQFGERLFAGNDNTVININALDPECPYGRESHDEREEDGE